jgi:hypothetical protein
MKLDLSDVKAALRTAGALLVGNSFVVPILARTNDYVVWSLLIAGSVLILIMSLKKDTPCTQIQQSK